MYVHLSRPDRLYSCVYLRTKLVQGEPTHLVLALFCIGGVNMIHKYTLYCEPGHLFKSGKHYLTIGEWITDPSFLIICHGIMSEDEYRDFLGKKHIPIYQGVSFAWTGLYPAHESKKFALTQFCGYIHRTDFLEWSGYINVG